MNRTEILMNLDNPKQLEKLYRDNETAFKSTFNALYPELRDNKLAEYWKERLNYESAEISWGSSQELTFVIIAALVAGVLAKIPVFWNIAPEFFYPRNIGFIIFPILTTYFIWRQGLSTKKMVMAFMATLLPLVFINLLPNDIDNSDTLALACMHLPLFLWAVLGFAYIGDHVEIYRKRLDFLRYNGDLVIMTGLILIAGGILTGMTIGLFSVIGFDIEEFYIPYIGVFGLVAAPIVGTFITQTNPQLIHKVSPVIAKIFSPLVLITLVVYLVAMVFSGKDPYQDREFLIIFNLLLIGVMAIILFSVAETFKQDENRVNSYILLALSVLTVLVNGIALSAILFRISEWGITPNRLAVLGANVLILSNLLMVAFQLFKHVSKKTDMSAVENSISRFLPVYILWTVMVIFIFPFLFYFK